MRHGLDLSRRLDRQSEGNIPQPSTQSFVDGIDHPDLYLWDAWSEQFEDALHLYCLAVSKTLRNGECLCPSDRNQAEFHIRHFLSVDSGITWHDQGCFQEARVGQNLFDSRTLWSGSMLGLDESRQLSAYTGIRAQSDDLLFQQSLCLAMSSDWNHIIPGSQRVISDPLSDWQSIVDLGYYLGDLDTLGHKDGENDGPILAWRDPFLFKHNGQVHVYWGAKLSSDMPALGHAVLNETDHGFEMGKMYPPIAMPDGSLYTQLELPKVLYDERGKKFYLLVASCNRLHESQSDAEADKRTRLYQSDSLNGSWQECGHTGSTLSLAEPNMFGITVLNADFGTGKMHYVAPYTEAAGADKFLTLSKTYSLDLNDLSVARL